jgi:REP element-mobilizing transposase RayT
LVYRCWLNIPHLHPGAGVDQFALMPDHLHGILTLDAVSSAKDKTRTLSSLVGAFKSRVARLVGQESWHPRFPIWQRGFHDRIIRGQRELCTIRRYVTENCLATTLPPRIRNR